MKKMMIPLVSKSRTPLDMHADGQKRFLREEGEVYGEDEEEDQGSATALEPETLAARNTVALKLDSPICACTKV